MKITVALTTLGAAVVLPFLVVRGPAMAASGAEMGFNEFVSSVFSRADTIPLYTEEQLAKGTELYKKVCADCHEDADYTSDKFRKKWTGKTMYDFFEDVSSKMPDDNPGGLTRDEYANALAYILKLNGVRAGPVAVAPDSTAMKIAILHFTDPTKTDTMKVDTLMMKVDTLMKKVDTLLKKVDTLKVDTLTRKSAVH